MFAREASVVLHGPLAVALGERGAGRLVLDRAWGMSRPMDDASPLFTAAASVSGAVEEVHEIDWPVCAVHGGDPTTRDLHGE